MKKKTILLVIMLIGLLSVTGCGSKTNEGKKDALTMKVLYKMHINELPYLKENFISYFVDTGSNKVGFIIDENNHCTFNQSIKNNNYSKNILSRECSYSVNDSNLYLKIEAGITTINGSNVENTSEHLEISGKFNETLEELKLELSDADYILINKTYQKLLDRNLTYALYDNETKEIYDLNGLSINAIDFSDNNNLNGKQVQLDLSKYEIKESGSLDKGSNRNSDSQNQLNEPNDDNEIKTSNEKVTKEDAKMYAETMIKELKRQYSEQGIDFDEALRKFGYSSESEYFNDIYEAYLNQQNENE